MLDKKTLEMFGLDEPSDPKVQEELEFLEQLKSKYTLEEIYKDLCDSDLDFEISKLKDGGIKTIEDKKHLLMLKLAKQSRDFEEHQELDLTKKDNEEPETLYF